MTRIVYRSIAIAVCGLVGSSIAYVVLTEIISRDHPAHAQQTRSRAGGSQKADSDKPTATKSVPSMTTTESPRRTTSQPAQVLPYEQTEILAKASGFVSRVHVDLGDKVEKDQILAELWIPEMDQERLSRSATVDEAAATIQQAQAAILAGQALVDAAAAKQREALATVAQYEADVAFRRSEQERFERLVGEKAIHESLLD